MVVSFKHVVILKNVLTLRIATYLVCKIKLVKLIFKKFEFSVLEILGLL